MRTLFVFIIFILILSTIATAQLTVALRAPQIRIAPEEYRVDTNTIALYHLNEGIGLLTSDASPYGHNGTLLGNSQWTQAGIFNRALVFNGLNDSSPQVSVVEVQDAPSLDLTNNFTIEAWVKPAEILDHDAIICKGQASGHAAYCLDVLSGGYRFFGFDSNLTVYEINSVATQRINTWQHIAATFDGQEFKLYVDGILQGTVAFNGQFMTNNEPLTIGARKGFQNVYDWAFNGTIDEVRISDRARQLSEFNL